MTTDKTMTEAEFREWLESLPQDGDIDIAHEELIEPEVVDKESGQIEPGRHWLVGSYTLADPEDAGRTVAWGWQANAGYVDLNGNQRFDTDTVRGLYSYIIEEGDGDGDMPAVSGVTVLDDDGDPVDAGDLAHIIREVLLNVRSWESQVEDLLPEAPEAEDADDNDKEIDMDAYIAAKLEEFKDQETGHNQLTNDNGRDVAFNGWLLAEVTSHEYQGPRNNRWTDLDLYLTKGGKLVMQETGKTCWQGESDRYAVTICNSVAELLDAAGTGWLAKAMYRKAGVAHAEEIE